MRMMLKIHFCAFTWDTMGKWFYELNLHYFLNIAEFFGGDRTEHGPETKN